MAVLSIEVKQKIKDVADDFKMPAKSLIEIGAKFYDKPKSSSQNLTEDQLNVIFDYITQVNQIESLEQVFAVAQKAEPAPVKEEAVAEAPAEKPVRSVLEKPEVTMLTDDQIEADSAVAVARDFLKEMTRLMGVEVEICMGTDAEGNVYGKMNGDTLGILIGRRGETLDALQYLTSLKVNRGREGYTRVTLDTENYRERRKETLENLAKNVAFKVKRTRRPVFLEPMNPYERRIIHTAVQKVNGATSWSEGENLNRHVVIGVDPKARGNYRNNRGRRPYSKGPKNNAPKANPDRKPLNEGEGMGLYGRIDK